MGAIYISRADNDGLYRSAKQCLSLIEILHGDHDAVAVAVPRRGVHARLASQRHLSSSPVCFLVLFSISFVHHQTIDRAVGMGVYAAERPMHRYSGVGKYLDSEK